MAGYPSRKWLTSSSEDAGRSTFRGFTLVASARLTTPVDSRARQCGEDPLQAFAP